MRRREFMGGLGSAGAAVWPSALRAQQPVMPAIGYLYFGSPGPSARLLAAFRKGLSDNGFVEGRNVAIEFRWAESSIDRLPDLASDLVHRKVAVIVTLPNVATTLAAKAATKSIPIVFGIGGDPVQAGVVASLNRPGGNVTGLTTMNMEVATKRLGLLHELLPGAARFLVLVNPNARFAQSTVTRLRTAASTIGLEVESLAAGTNRDIDAAFARLAQTRADALMVIPDPLFADRREQIIDLAARHAVPVVYPDRAFVEAGGLMSYGSSFSDLFRETGIYAGRILKGEKPADMPVVQPTKFDLVINLKTAKALGLTVPPTLLVMANDVIE